MRAVHHGCTGGAGTAALPAECRLCHRTTRIEAFCPCVIPGRAMRWDYFWCEPGSQAADLFQRRIACTLPSGDGPPRREVAHRRGLHNRHLQFLTGPIFLLPWYCFVHAAGTVVSDRCLRPDQVVKDATPFAFGVSQTGTQPCLADLDVLPAKKGASSAGKLPHRSNAKAEK